jgi:hypothetical protein
MNAYRPLALVSLIACAPVQRTSVQVQDPHAVALEVPEEEGPRTVLPAGEDPGEAPMAPDGAVPKISSVTALRDGAGGIALRCDRCILAPPTPVMGGDGHIVAHGPPEKTIRREGDIVRIHVPYNTDALATSHLFGPGRRRTWSSLVLATPASNVVEIQNKKGGYTAAGIILLGAAAVVGTLGATAVAARDGADPAQRPLLLGTGVAGIVLGAGLGIGGAGLILAPRPRAESM